MWITVAGSLMFASSLPSICCRAESIDEAMRLASYESRFIPAGCTAQAREWLHHRFDHAGSGLAAAAPLST